MLAGTSVLVVEPEYLIALDVQRIVSSAGAETSVATGPREARQHLAERQFDLAIVALDPHGGELAFCRELQDRGVRVVIVSDVPAHGDGHADLPGAGVVLKPFDDTDLLTQVRAALAGHGPRPCLS